MVRFAMHRLLLGLLLLLTAACGEAGTGKPRPLRVASGRPMAGEPGDDQIAAGTAPRALVEAVANAHERVRTAAARLEGARRAALDRLLPKQGRFQRPLEAVYLQIDSPLYFLWEGASGKDLAGQDLAQPLLDFIDTLGAHALAPEPYARERLLEARSERETALSHQAEAVKALEARLHAEPRLEKVRDLLHPERLPDALAERLGLRGLASLQPEAVRALATAEEALVNANLELAVADARLDVLLLRAIMQAVLDFRLLKRAHPFLALKHPDRAPDYYAEKLAAWLLPGVEIPVSGATGGGTAAKETEPPRFVIHEGADPRKDLSAFLEEQIPPTPLYGRTLEALRRYRDLAARAESQPPAEIARRGPELKLGRKGGEVLALKKRLAFEGYYPHNQGSDERFGRALVKALRDYQRTHQVDVTGRLDRMTRGSLRRPMADRVRQIELSLQRYRESDINADRPGVYLRVNIPEFAVELWGGGKLLRKHAVVVGNNSWQEDPRRKVVGNLNRTRLFKARVESVVLNPYWRVPSRIKSSELDEKLIDEPDFYERNHYEVVTTGSGREVVRQMPSEGNALGRVKINFPNPHAIFMHDTPAKSLFKRTFRSYSHGCIRLDKPLDMARYLLEQDGKLDEEEFVAILDSFKETTLRLRKPVPIYVEYNVVTVDEQGRPHFLSDIYKYDRGYFKGELPAVNEYELEAWRKGKKVPFKGVVKVRTP